ncbi:MAG: fibrobacter succinogenes major paralogous domain-containing protein [Bacteroidota bacterium]|jgi:uncharacterized protein (TIGR02145 family)
MKQRIVILLILEISFLISCNKDKSTNPNNNSDEVTIGTQVWMKRNLDVDHYRNGDPIPEVQDSIAWSKLTKGAWCYYNNDPAIGAIYGKLYNWYAVNDSRGLAPEGWHVPSKDEWQELENSLGGENLAGGKLKETGTVHWNSPNTGATNEKGFSALPGGCRGYYGPIGQIAYFWSSTGEEYLSLSWFRTLKNYNATFEKGFYYKERGFSVRCVKD